ncbi:MAG TPA: flippase-like domain-containing protein [Hyphomicrobiales bacterium]|nr:flippase-like domain-containing protein [Hyphomicrobiales bacterium]
MKTAALAVWMVGIVAVVGMVIWSGAGSVGDAVARAGWGVLAVVLLRAVQMASAGAAWWLVLPPAVRPPLGMVELLRMVREGGNSLLPVAQVGGDVIGARLLTFWRIDGATAAASVIVDVTMLAGTQFAFTVIGVLLLAYLSGSGPIVRDTAAGLVLAACGLTALFLIQGKGGRGALQRLLGRIAGGTKWQALAAIDKVYGALGMLYARRAALAGAATIHLVIWFIGVGEVWAALAAMGYPLSYREALVIESLLHALRGAAFLVPGALGIQEGGAIALCALFGVPMDAALALSLIKRIADAAIGIPGLVFWQALEGRRFLRGRRPGPPLPQPAEGPSRS